MALKKKKEQDLDFQMSFYENILKTILNMLMR